MSSDAGKRRSPADLVALVEGLALKRPPSSAAAIHRQIGAVAKAEGWHIPSYGTVHAIIAALDLTELADIEPPRGYGRD